MKNKLILVTIVGFFALQNLFSQNTMNVNSNRVDTNIVMPPAWAFGMLYGGYTNQKETIKRIKQIKKHKYPIDAYWIDSWFWSYADKGIGPHKYIDFVADTISYPDRKKMWDFMSKNGIKGGFWIWDCILKTGNESAFKNFEENNFFSSIFLNKNSWHNSGKSTALFQENKEHPGTLCGNIDFKNEAAVKHFKKLIKPFFDEGADFIKLDRTSEIEVCKTMFEMSQDFGKETNGRGFMLSHSFGTENEEYKRYPTKWTDDTRSDWTIETPLIEFDTWVPKVALKENIAMFTDLNKATSKIPFLTNDLGGFDMGKTDKPEEELYIRWLQFSVFNPITEVFSQPENPTSNLAWKHSKRADKIFRFYAQWRMKLFPYIYSYALRSRLESKHMIGKFPEHIYQYKFGEEMLLAPVYVKLATKQTVFLPEGNWINYWTGDKLTGNKSYTVEAPLENIPLFIKEGAIIPSRNYAPSIEKGSNNEISLEIYPGTDGSFTLLEDDGTSNEYLDGKYSSTNIAWIEPGNQTSTLIIYPISGNYNGIHKVRTWKIRLQINDKPSSVKINDKEITFSFDKKENEVLVLLRAIPCNKKHELKFNFTD
jgi:alpha-glucosidase (family GH31 glycosyl hydrolase)